jgi:hypothetical protein
MTDSVFSCVFSISSEIVSVQMIIKIIILADIYELYLLGFIPKKSVAFKEFFGCFTHTRMGIVEPELYFRAALALLASIMSLHTTLMLNLVRLLKH